MDIAKSNQYAIVKDLLSSMRNGKTFNLPRLLEVLNTSTDDDVQVKLFSILSAYLMLKGDNNKAIITYNPVYDKICKILVNCPPRKTTIAFNFLSALLYVDDEGSDGKNSLVAYAQNMIRSSGCLAAMCDLFTTCMMHQDAWRALCRCLAESCHGVEANQSYCTHLVPMCVQRCSQRNTEVLLVLQSLLQNHKRNITLFVECNGISLFQREFLQHDICLQLLDSVVQCSTEAVALIVKTDICQQLRDFLQLYGPQSQLGQWATIVLYHTTRVEAICEDQKVDEKKKEHNKLSESLLRTLHPVYQNRVKESSADTTKFFQNVMKEILQCGSQKEFNNLKSFFPTDIMTNKNQRYPDNYAGATGMQFDDITQRKKFWLGPRDPNKFYARRVKPTVIRNDSHKSQFSKTNELSLSFLRNHHFNKKHITTNFVTADKLPENFQRTYQTNDSRVRKNTVYESLMENESLNTLGTNDFKPQFASTPKRYDDYLRYEKPYSINKTGRSIQKSVRNLGIKRRLETNKIAKHLERCKMNKEIIHKSFSGRFFDAINTSCTTLVKTVKNIFRPKSDLSKTKDDSLNKTSNRDNLTCSYSFTNYMRRRDADLKKDCLNESSGGLVDLKPKENFDDFSLEMSNSCNTCNDTITLKRKLTNDKHLKQTIRKLKLGINLYGCDFKKISRTMWAKENYMTPAVLYNLYRKLIIK